MLVQKKRIDSIHERKVSQPVAHDSHWAVPMQALQPPPSRKHFASNERVQEGFQDTRNSRVMPAMLPEGEEDGVTYGLGLTRMQVYRQFSQASQQAIINQTASRLMNSSQKKRNLHYVRATHKAEVSSCGQPDGISTTRPKSASFNNFGPQKQKHITKAKSLLSTAASNQRFSVGSRAGMNRMAFQRQSGYQEFMGSIGTFANNTRVAHSKDLSYDLRVLEQASGSPSGEPSMPVVFSHGRINTMRANKLMNNSSAASSFSGSRFRATRYGQNASLSTQPLHQQHQQL